MNIERLRAVRDAILNPPEGYGLAMETFVDTEADCGTAFCIAGWALHLNGFGATDIEHMNAPEGDAMRLLGLNPRQAGRLFFPNLLEPHDPAMAAATIDHLIATGEVVWAAP